MCACASASASVSVCLCFPVAELWKEVLSKEKNICKEEGKWNSESVKQAQTNMVPVARKGKLSNLKYAKPAVCSLKVKDGVSGEFKDVLSKVHSRAP